MCYIQLKHEGPCFKRRIYVKELNWTSREVQSGWCLLWHQLFCQLWQLHPEEFTPRNYTHTNSSCTWIPAKRNALHSFTESVQAESVQKPTPTLSLQFSCDLPVSTTLTRPSHGPAPAKRYTFTNKLPTIFTNSYFIEWWLFYAMLQAKAIFRVRSF